MKEIPHSREFWTGVLKRIAKRTGGGLDAEDLMHSAYVRLEHYSATNTVADPAAFLVRTAVNIGIDGYRHDRRIYGKRCLPLPDREDTGARADEVVVAKELLSRVVSGINHLPDRTREIFLMHRIDKLEYSEIARRLGISESAIEKQMAKAMMTLADCAKAW
ncbi:MAG: sigma-70 family RNA polymerase sigma factor [Alphaproteobacteria bacterium]|nr:sigma-70 family RNA polymerase sigma factor [Alphaproteobacteria bacterium]